MPVLKTVYLEKAPLIKAREGFFGLSEPALVKRIKIEFYNPFNNQITGVSDIANTLIEMMAGGKKIVPLCSTDKWGVEHCSSDKISSNPLEIIFDSPQNLQTTNQFFVKSGGYDGRLFYPNSLIRIVDIEFSNAKLGSTLPFEIFYIPPESVNYNLVDDNIIKTEVDDRIEYLLFKTDFIIPNNPPFEKYEIERAMAIECLTDNLQVCPFDYIRLTLHEVAKRIFSSGEIGEYNPSTIIFNPPFKSMNWHSGEQGWLVLNPDNPRLEIIGVIDKSNKPNFSGNFWFKLDAANSRIIADDGRLIRFTPTIDETRKFNSNELD